MNWRPRNRRLFCFAVPYRGKFQGSTLYQPKDILGSLSRAEDIWVLAWADDCQFTWHKGFHGLLDDGLELEPSNLDLWEEHKDDPEFAEMKQFVEEVEGIVETKIVHERSILAEVSKTDTFTNGGEIKVCGPEA